MAGRMINGVRYIGLRHDNFLKSLSLEDNVYFTLSDIFWNGEVEDCFASNYFNEFLTHGVHYDERDHRFHYADLSAEDTLEYRKKLSHWFETRFSSKDTCFDFQCVEESVIDMERYLSYDTWWTQLEELREKLKQGLETPKIEESI